LCHGTRSGLPTECLPELAARAQPSTLSGGVSSDSLSFSWERSAPWSCNGVKRFWRTAGNSQIGSGLYLMRRVDSYVTCCFICFFRMISNAYLVDQIEEKSSGPLQRCQVRKSRRFRHSKLTESSKRSEQTRSNDRGQKTSIFTGLH